MKQGSQRSDGMIRRETAVLFFYERIYQKLIKHIMKQKSKSGSGNSISQMKGKALVCLLLLSALYVQAQDGSAGIQAANTQVRGYFDAGTQLMYAVGALVGLIGAVKVYQKWNSGDQDTSKVAASWFGSCIFLVVVALIIRSFFGI
jgi:hypothetical protein